MLALASQPLLSIGDTAMIGRLGVEPLAARAVGAAIIGGIYWIFTFLSFGTTSLVGHHHGANDFKACGETYFHALCLAVLGGLAVTCAGLLFAPQLYNVMGAVSNVAAEGVPYFRIYIASAPFTFIFFASVGFFRGTLDTRTPMIIAFLISGTHLLLDYGLIYGNFGFPRLGIRGAAVAAWVGQFVGAATCLGIFFFSRSTAEYRRAKWRLSLTRLRPLFRIGSDLAIRTGALRGSLVFATSCTARMGASVLSAHEIAFQLMLLSSDVIDGLAVAGQALAAKYLGSGQKETAYAMGKTLILCGAVAGLIFGIAFLGAQDAIVSFFTNSPKRQASARRRCNFTGRPISAVEWNRICSRWTSDRRPRHPLSHVGDAHRCSGHLCYNFLDVSSLGLGSNRNLGRSRCSDVLAPGHVALPLCQPELVGKSKSSGYMMSQRKTCPAF